MYIGCIPVQMNKESGHDRFIAQKKVWNSGLAFKKIIIQPTQDDTDWSWYFSHLSPTSSNQVHRSMQTCCWWLDSSDILCDMGRWSCGGMFVLEYVKYFQSKLFILVMLANTKEDETDRIYYRIMQICTKTIWASYTISGKFKMYTV